MPELTKEEKIKLFQKLPKNLQDLMDSEDTGAVLLYLGQKYNLPNERVHLLSKLVGDIILGIVPIADMLQEIIAKIISDPQAAANLAQDLNDEIFIPKPAVPGTPIPAPAPAPIAPPAMPEIIDLRKTPPPPIPMPVAAAPIPPVVNRVEPPKPAPPLIEADPHKKEVAADKYREQIDVLDLRQDKGEF